MSSTEISRLLIGFGIVFCFCLIRSLRKQKLIESNDFVEIAFAIGGMILTVGLFIKVLTDKELLDKIGTDGLLALFVGMGTQIISSLTSELKEDCIFVYTKIKQLF